MKTAVNAAAQPLPLFAQALQLALEEAAGELGVLLGEAVEVLVRDPEQLRAAECSERIRCLGGPEAAWTVRQPLLAPDAAIDTECWLALPASSKRELIQRMLGGDADPQGVLEQDSLAELANVLLNACSNGLAALLGENLAGGLPRPQPSPCWTGQDPTLSARLEIWLTGGCLAAQFGLRATPALLARLHARCASFAASTIDGHGSA